MDAVALQASFASDGFVSIPGFLDAEELQAIRSDLERVVRDVVPRMPAEEVYHEDVDDPSSLKQLQRLHVHDPTFNAHLAKGPFARLAAVLLDEYSAPQNLQYFDKAPGTNRPTPAHQDGAYFPITPVNAVTIWLALENVGREQGCMRFARGSHLEGLRPHQRGGTLGFSRELVGEEGGNEVAVPCEAGHVTAHHALTVHRADGNSSPDRHRRALGFIYYGASCVIDEDARAGYQARLDEELRAAGRLGEAPS
jgi:phytanoyl-CoA hydroxylase